MCHYQALGQKLLQYTCTTIHVCVVLIARALFGWTFSFQVEHANHNCLNQASKGHQALEAHSESQ